MIKMVASDLDGTLLLNKAQSLPEEIFPLIRKLKEMGILFVAASGRQYPNMKRMFAPVASEIAYISENGALAVDQEEVLYQDSFDRKVAAEIIEAIIGKKGRGIYLLCQRLSLPDAEDRTFPGAYAL